MQRVSSHLASFSFPVPNPIEIVGATKLKELHEHLLFHLFDECNLIHKVIGSVKLAICCVLSTISTEAGKIIS